MKITKKKVTFGAAEKNRIKIRVRDLKSFIICSTQI